jgi:hypothetical protein
MYYCLNDSILDAIRWISIKQYIPLFAEAAILPASMYKIHPKLLLIILFCIIWWKYCCDSLVTNDP